MMRPEPEILKAARRTEARARNWLELVKHSPDFCQRRTAEAELENARARVRTITRALENFD
jgi:hypothetical protein